MRKVLAIGSIGVVVLLIFTIFPSTVEADVASLNGSANIFQKFLYSKKLIDTPGQLINILARFIFGLLWILFGYLSGYVN